MRSISDLQSEFSATRLSKAGKYYCNLSVYLIKTSYGQPFSWLIVIDFYFLFQ
jgi:hypothetical protein